MRTHARGRRALLDWTARVSEFLRLASGEPSAATPSLVVLYIFKTDHGAGQFSPPQAAIVS